MSGIGRASHNSRRNSHAWIAHRRRPIGKLSGRLVGFSASELGGSAIRAALERAGVPVADVDYVIMRRVLLGGVGQMPARQEAKSVLSACRCPATMLMGGTSSQVPTGATWLGSCWLGSSLGPGRGTGFIDLFPESLRCWWERRL
jgi:hypothetical protein